MALKGLVSIQLRPGRGRRFDEIRTRLQRPLAGRGGTIVAQVMRKGEGSVAAQFKAETELLFRGGRSPWKRTQPFGRRAAPAKTLQRTGALRRAWTGDGPGSLTMTRANRVTIGVDTARFPQAAMFQRLGLTLVRPKQAGPRGRSAMGWFLGMRYGVWISEARLKRGLAIEGRRVSINPAMMKRVKVSLLDWIVTGTASIARAA